MEPEVKKIDNNVKEALAERQLLFNKDEKIEEKDLGLLIWQASPLLDHKGKQEGMVVVPVMVIKVDEDGVVMRPRIYDNGVWKVFPLGTDNDGNQVTEIVAKYGDGILNRFIKYDWYSHSGGKWSNEIYEK